MAVSVGRGLMAAVVAVRLLAVEAERPHDREIVKAEEAGILTIRGVGVLVEGPGRHAEDVALLPVEAATGDDRMAGTLCDLVDDAAGVAVRPRRLAGAQQLHGGAQRLHHWPAGHRIDVVHLDAVMRRPVARPRI